MFIGCVKDWKAFSKWNVSNGGLNYLQVSCMLCSCLKNSDGNMDEILLRNELNCFHARKSKYTFVKCTRVLTSDANNDSILKSMTVNHEGYGY